MSIKIAVEFWCVTVEWVNPSSFRPAPVDRLLSLNVDIFNSKAFPWVKFNNDDGEKYFFADPESAKAFKRKIDEHYAEHPQYFVIDDEQNIVLDDESGEPIVAWMPQLTIERIIEDAENVE